jgi:hypothetical protein
MTNKDETIAAGLQFDYSFVTTLSQSFSRMVYIFQSFSSGNCEPKSPLQTSQRTTTTINQSLVATMPEPVVLSIIASTIAVVTLAYKSTKTLVEFIDSLQGAPKLIKDVKGDVKAVQHILKSIELLLEPRSETNASTDLQDCLNSARVPIQDCDNACTEFAKDLKEWFRHNLSDKLTTNFKETKIANFRMRLRDTRGTLDLALNVCSM